MSIRGDGFKFGVLQRWVTRLLLLAFVGRALVPVGYMPDFSAASNGVFKVVICSAMGAKTIALDGSGKQLPDQEDVKHNQPCAFTGMAAVALSALDAIPLEVKEFQTPTFTPRLAVELPPARAGPQLGSRGPPQLS
ncbi:MAG: DUF2946 domain-containing protein [Hyphomicrobium sp.]|nr:DUF2946 domain-containing protein [Hyphomicrobium sp.]